MVLIAFVLIAAGMAAAVGLVLGGNTDPVTLTVFDRPLPETTAVGVFGAGAAATMLVVCGMSVLKASLRRSLERRREIQDLEDEHEELMSRLEDENALLKRELEQARSRDLATGATTGLAPSATGLAPAAPPPAAGDPLAPGPPAGSTHGLRDVDDPWADLRDHMDATSRRPPSAFDRH